MSSPSSSGPFGVVNTSRGLRYTHLISCKERRICAGTWSIEDLVYMIVATFPIARGCVSVYGDGSSHSQGSSTVSEWFGRESRKSQPPRQGEDVKYASRRPYLGKLSASRFLIETRNWPFVTPHSLLLCDQHDTGTWSSAVQRAPVPQASFSPFNPQRKAGAHRQNSVGRQEPWSARCAI